MKKPRQKLFSFVEALEWFAANGHDVAEGTFNAHVHVDGRIQPLRIGERQYDDRVLSRSIAFTRRMLQAYAAGARDVKPTAVEERDFIGTSRAAELFPDLTDTALRRAVHAGRVWSQNVGNALVLYRPDLVDYVENRRRRPGAPGGEAHPLARLTADAVREMRRLYDDEGWQLDQLADKYNVTISHVSRVVRRLVWKGID